MDMLLSAFLLVFPLYSFAHALYGRPSALLSSPYPARSASYLLPPSLPSLSLSLSLTRPFPFFTNPAVSRRACTQRRGAQLDGGRARGLRWRHRRGAGRPGHRVPFLLVPPQARKRPGNAGPHRAQDSRGRPRCGMSGTCARAVGADRRVQRCADRERQPSPTASDH